MATICTVSNTWPQYRVVNVDMVCDCGSLSAESSDHQMRSVFVQLLQGQADIKQQLTQIQKQSAVVSSHIIVCQPPGIPAILFMKEATA